MMYYGLDDIIVLNLSDDCLEGFMIMEFDQPFFDESGYSNVDNQLSSSTLSIKRLCLTSVHEQKKSSRFH